MIKSPSECDRNHATYLRPRSVEIFSCANGRGVRTCARAEFVVVVLGHGRYYRRRGRGRRDGAVSYEPKLVGNTTAKDKWRGLMKWTDGRDGQGSRMRVNQAAVSHLPPVRARVCGLSIENLVKRKGSDMKYGLLRGCSPLCRAEKNS